jgi:N-formylglutamate deformylase
MNAFTIHPAEGEELPILVSVPHCGINFPDDIKDQYKSPLIEEPDDTDWFVDKLYGFVPSLGITMISANYSRWVIDLNRDPDSKPLYTDGRIITALCPTTDFLGNPLYNDERKDVAADEVARRLDLYYKPYHHQLEEQLTRLQAKFKKVLLWDCHSIRQVVPTIQPDALPDLILGDADGRAAEATLTLTALQSLRSTTYQVNHNHPFKGGTITRHFGAPANGRNALQLEMTKVHYMDDTQLRYDLQRATAMQKVLKRTLENLAAQLQQ